MTFRGRVSGRGLPITATLLPRAIYTYLFTPETNAYTSVKPNKFPVLFSPVEFSTLQFLNVFVWSAFVSRQSLWVCRDS